MRLRDEVRAMAEAAIPRDIRKCFPREKAIRLRHASDCSHFARLPSPGCNCGAEALYAAWVALRNLVWEMEHLLVEETPRCGADMSVSCSCGRYERAA